MKRDKPWIEKPISNQIFDFNEEYRLAIFDLDFQTTGEKREELLYPYLSSSKVFIENGKITGLYLPGLREGLIYAQSEKAELRTYEFEILHFR